MIGGCGTARPSLALFPRDLPVTKFDIGEHDYHALKVAVVKDSVFQEENSEHLGDKRTKNLETGRVPHNLHLVELFEGDRTVF